MADDFTYDQLDPVARTCRLSDVFVSSYTTTVTIPAYYKDRDNVTYTVTAIKEGLFNSGETKVTEVVIPATVTVIGHAGEGFAADDQYTSNFTECPNLEKITVKEGNPVFESDGGVLYATVDGQKVLLNVPEKIAVSNTGAFTVPAGTARIARDAFAECSTVKSITFPADVEIDYNGGLCRMNWVTSYWVTGTGSLSVVDGMLVKTDGDQKDIISYPRYAYPPNSNNQLTIKVDYRTILPYAFANCDHVDKVIFNGTVKNIGEYAFARSNMRSITMPAGVNYLGGHTFEQCILLRSLSVKGSDVELPEYFAYGSYGLQSVTGDIKKLGDYAFANCNALKEFPLTTTMVLGEGAFSGSFKGQKVEFKYAEGDQALTPGEGAFSVAGLTTLDLSAFATTPTMPYCISNRFVHYTDKLSFLTLPDFVEFPSDGYANDKIYDLQTHMYLHSFTNPSGNAQFWYCSSAYQRPTLWVAVTALTDKYDEADITWPLSSLLYKEDAELLVPTVVVDAYTPAADYVIPGASYLVPGGAVKNYREAEDAGCEVGEIYGVTFSNVNGKLRVDIDLSKRPLAVAGIKEGFKVTFNDEEPVGVIDMAATSTLDIAMIEKVRVSYTIHDYEMCTDYPKTAWSSSAIESVSAEAAEAEAAEYFTVTGRKVADPKGGFFIKRTASGASKVAL